jgi:hypothetical protein
MITITFNPYTPEQMAILTAAMNAYMQAGAAAELASTPVNVPITEAEAQPEPAKAKRASPKKPAAEEAPEPVTLEQLRAKMAAVSQAGKGPECKALLVKFGASNLTSVPAEKYSDLMNEVGAL